MLYHCQKTWNAALVASHNIFQLGVLKNPQSLITGDDYNCMSYSNNNILSPICCFMHWDVCLSIGFLLLLNLGCTVSPQCRLRSQNKKNWQWLTEEEKWVIVRIPISWYGQWCLANCNAPLLTVWSPSHRAHCAAGEDAMLLQSNTHNSFRHG